MRKVVVFNLVSLDGLFAGPDGDLDWHVVDEEFNAFAEEQLRSMDTILFGRVTYQMRAAYWPTQAATRDNPVIAGLMNSHLKVVFSRTLEKVVWPNSRLAKEEDAQEISKLKEQPGKDMVVFGSASLASSLTKRGLIDEFRVLVNPVVLGDGKPLFKDVENRFKLKLLRSRTFGSGNVLLVYQPDRK